MDTTLLTELEAAEYLLLNRRQLRKLVDQGVLAALVYPGNELRFFQDDLDRWLAGRRVNRNRVCDSWEPSPVSAERESST